MSIDTSTALVATGDPQPQPRPLTDGELAALAVFSDGEILSLVHASYGGQAIRADSPASRFSARALVDMGILEPAGGAFVGSWYQFTPFGVACARMTAQG